MRQIKFRAWDAWHKCFFRPIYNASQGELTELLIRPADSRQALRTLSGFDDESMFEGRFILSQFTGLTDKNGKDIYEGDIVKWDDQSNGKYWRFAEVKIGPDIYFDCATILDAEGIKNSSNHQFHYGRFIYKDTENHLVVIGNIYEPFPSLNQLADAEMDDKRDTSFMSDDNEAWERFKSQWYPNPRTS